MDGASTTRLRIGEIVARCPSCGCADFVAPADGELELVCAGCRAASPRSALVAQIAREAIERADHVLRAARKPP